MIYLDTHVVAWLYAGRTDLLPPLARSLIEGNDLLVSPMVALELQYLFEIERISVEPNEILDALGRELQLKECNLPFRDVVNASLRESWTRDPFDRLIVGQANLRGAPLLSKDETIRANYSDAVWDEGV
jgi:PIN domain nuclease of toxin-antitoxin system